MGSAETAYRCLTTKDVAEAQKLADELEGINKSRADLQNLIWDEVRAEVTRGIDAGKFSHAVVVSSPNWHEGVVGIVASKVTEHFKKPAVILAIREDGIAKGSVRSYGGYNVLEALHLSKSFLKGYGGHKFAAGLSLAPEQIEAFAEHYNLMMQSLAPTKKSDDLQIEGRCTLADFTPQALGQLEKLAPFGPGNPEPLFSLHAQVATQNILKGRHVKLKLCETGSKQVIEGLWFNAAERLESTQLMEKCAHSKITCAFAGIPELNRFLGRTTPTLRIKAATEVQ